MSECGFVIVAFFAFNFWATRILVGYRIQMVVMAVLVVMRPSGMRTKVFIAVGA
jgi:hypothetical protein